MNPPSNLPWRWPILRVRPVLALLGVGLAFGLLQGLAVGLSLRAEGQAVPWSRPLFWEITGALSAFLMFPLPQTAVLNAPSPKAGWFRFFGLHAGAYLAYTSLHIGLMMLVRYPLYRWLGWGTYHYGDLLFKIPMEMAKDLLGYFLFALGLTLYGVWKEGQARALREVQLEAQLKEAQLQALVGNLDPHFLFNALNTISSVMYEDLPRTDALLSDLGLLLRASFEGGAAWTLGEERQHTERYAALLQARFGERFQLAWNLEPGLEGLRVPRFAVQLLVENGVKHNGDLDHPLEVRISGQRTGSELRLRVEDNGAGFAPGETPGTGLATLRKGLGLMFGAAGRLDCGNRPEGGAWVEVAMGPEARP
jgi:signal transduction histidine kinase